jgi:selenide,water dikinase
MTTSAASVRDVVLVGGGHSHVQVLRRFAERPPPRARVTVVVDTPLAVYSGMVPGFVAGQYEAHELEIDVVALAQKARASVVVARATGIDAAGSRILVEGREPIRYDVASINVGSVVAGLDLPGVRDHAVPTRPVGRFVSTVDAAVKRAASARSDAHTLAVVVVGGGVAGVELAFTIDQRLRKLGSKKHRVTILHEGPRLLPNSVPTLSARVARLAADRDIKVRTECAVIGARDGAVLLAEGSEAPFDLLLWVTGAASQPLFRDSGLAVDGRGFVLVRSTLQVQGHDNLFAAGDCATLIDHRGTAKAGVYAVREGPYLIDNLLAFHDGRPLRHYKPQGDFLALMNLGDGTAVATKWGISFHGRWVMRLKDRIDRRFVRRFQVR